MLYSYEDNMSKKLATTLNPKLKAWSAALSIAASIVILGAVEALHGLIGAALGGGLAYLFYYVGIRLIAKAKHVDLQVKKITD